MRDAGAATLVDDSQEGSLLLGETHIRVDPLQRARENKASEPGAQADALGGTAIFSCGWVRGE